ncbi:hypothetical protein GCM10010082_31410 [Kushneria pakistanensis]|uniref:Uncharacterized protein n=1 Tax=Kushneria pakistanensis TaxID=1508770 RepID=A0ABQ3FRA6_9GAMM|nr:hypothetical protein [Kushneria pakistanensis]GHC34467.1 hypothetical protein GCM10010082_31410 [Kushneria pakistanensis]
MNDVLIPEDITISRDDPEGIVLTKEGKAVAFFPPGLNDLTDEQVYDVMYLMNVAYEEGTQRGGGKPPRVPLKDWL